MYSNRQSKVTTKSRGAHRKNGRRMMNSSSRTVNRSKHGFIEGDLQGSKDSGFAEHISTGQEITYAASATVNSSNNGRFMCRHGCVRGDMQESKDRGFTEDDHIASGKDNEFIENDNMSQESNESESYNEANLAKSVSYHNVAHLSQTSEDFQIELSENVGNDDEALKEELMHIFEREREALEMYFKNKMDERFRAFRSRQMEFEEATRAEKVELENNMSIEKMEMQKTFAEEIAKLTHTFNEERQQLEMYYKDQLKDLREKLVTEQKQMDEKFAQEKIDLKGKLEAEYQAMVRGEVSHEKQEAAGERSELEARFHREKHELEKSYNFRLTEAETNLQKLKAEFEANLTEERMRMEKQSQDNGRDLDAKLQEERRLRHDKERELEQDREKYSKEDSLNKKENGRLRNDVDALRREIDEKNRETVQVKSFEENVKLRGREGLDGKLKDDFEKLLEEHKMELDKNYQKEKEKLDENLQAERRQIKEEHDKQKAKIKAEQDDIIRTRERLRVEEKSKIDRQQQHSADSELIRPPLSDHRVEHASEITDRKTQQERRGVSEWERQPLDDQQIVRASGTKDRDTHNQQRDDTELVRLPLSDHRIESSTATKDCKTNHQQLADDGNGVKGDPYRRPPSLQQHQRQQPGNTVHYYQPFERKTGTGSNDQSGKGGHSLNVVSPENERELRAEMIALKSENEGLKAKIAALEENIELHKKYKEEAKAEMERLLKANQENDLRQHNLTREIEKRGRRNIEQVKANGRDYEAQVKSQSVDDRDKTAGKNVWELEGKLKGLEVRAERAEKRGKEYDARMRDFDEPRKETKRDYDLTGQLSVSRQEDQSRYQSVPRNDRQDSSYKAKYEVTLQEKNKLLQVTKDLQIKIKTLQEKQADILHHSSHVERSSEKNEETERLKQLVSENSSLKKRTSELQAQLQRLLEKLTNEKEKAASLETELSSHKSKNLHKIDDLQERLMTTGRELSSQRGDLDLDALKRIEKEILAIGQIVKSQFGDGSMGHVSHRSTNEDVARVTQLEVEKKELEMKLKIAREAMSEYVTCLNDKMKDVKSMTGMSEEMVQELHSRNNSLKKSLQTLEEGQKTSQLQNEQLRHQKSVLQNLIGDLCRDEKIADTSYNSSSTLLDSKHDDRSDEVGSKSYSTSPRDLDYKYQCKYSGSYDNRYDENSERNTEGKYLSQEFKEMQHGEKCSRCSKADRYSTVFEEYPSRYSSYEYKDFGRVSSLY